MISFTLTSLLFTVLLATSVHGFSPTPEPARSNSTSVSVSPSTSNSSPSNHGYPEPHPEPPATNCDKKNTIVATGVGHSSIKTTIAVISLGIQAKGKTAVIAQRKLTEKSGRLHKYLRAQKVDKLSTSGVYLNGDYNYNNPVPKIVGYSGSITVSFEVPIANSSTIFDGAVLNGANQVNGVTYKAAPAAQETAREAAVLDGVKKAKAEAAVAVKALRRILGKPVSVKIIDSFIPNGSTGYAGSYGHGGYGSFAGAEQSVTARVSVSFYVW